MEAIQKELPKKLYFSIGEVSNIVEVAPHVLRYWEKKFSQVRPIKRAGNRRFYRYQDVQTLLQIRHLLYDRGFTVAGARDYLRQKGRKDPVDLLDQIKSELRQMHRQLTN
ncbi:MAG: MerR family transcriptional regulator [Magnetococcales bacterium]|nr:MerR family transcriptional regulator [Magnetococcales bacterium]